MRWAGLLMILGCARPPAPVPPSVVATPVKAVEISPWAAMPVRVMAWTASGVVEIGALPGTLPAVMPERWYVEPTAKLDRAGFDRLIGLVRSEHVPGLSLRGQAIAGWLDAMTGLPELV